MSIRQVLSSVVPTLHIKTDSAPAGVSYVTNGLVFTWGALTLNQILMIVGTFFAVATYFTSLFFHIRRERGDAKLRRDLRELELRRERREVELHEQRMRSALEAERQSQSRNGSSFENTGGHDDGFHH